MYKYLLNVYFLPLRERERECPWAWVGQGQREREGQQWAWRRARTHEPQDHDLNRRWTLNRPSHPGAPVQKHFMHTFYLKFRTQKRWWQTKIYKHLLSRKLNILKEIMLRLLMKETESILRNLLWGMWTNVRYTIIRAITNFLRVAKHADKGLPCL